MTSTAMPPLYPPWEMDGVLYLDGGVTSHLPLQAAVARGANEIFALRNGHGFMLDNAPVQRNVFSIGSKAISLLVERQATLEIEAVQRDRSVRLHLINIHADDDPGLWNFTRAAELIAAGIAEVFGRRLAQADTAGCQRTWLPEGDAVEADSHSEGRHIGQPVTPVRAIASGATSAEKACGCSKR
jgi:predicted acylesterase/phospholipase RssA